MGLEEMLAFVMKESSLQMARQLEFVLKQLSAGKYWFDSVISSIVNIHVDCKC